MWEGASSPSSSCKRLVDIQLSAMGKTLSEEEKNKKAWDSNAITPGTPFMDLLAASLRYWVVLKMNQDPGWKDVSQVGCLRYHSIHHLHAAPSRYLRCQCARRG